MLKNKKSDIGIGVIFLIVVLVLFFGWLINVNQRECRTNKDCGSESYCGSDFSCHEYPNIQKTVVQYNFLVPSIIIGLAIIIGALIFRWNQLFPKEEKKVIIEQKTETTQIPEEVEDISEPYYKSDSKVRAP